MLCCSPAARSGAIHTVWHGLGLRRPPADEVPLVLAARGGHGQYSTTDPQRVDYSSGILIGGGLLGVLLDVVGVFGCYAILSSLVAVSSVVTICSVTEAEHLSAPVPPSDMSISEEAKNGARRPYDRRIIHGRSYPTYGGPQKRSSRKWTMAMCDQKRRGGSHVGDG